MKPSRESKRDQARRKEERDARRTLGLLVNSRPVVIATKYPQFTLGRDGLFNGSGNDADRRFMELLENHGRLLAQNRWIRYTLVHGETFKHDLGIFVALDIALATLMLNFYNDMQWLRSVSRHKKIRADDVRYLIDNVWSQRIVASSKILSHLTTPNRHVHVRPPPVERRL